MDNSIMTFGKYKGTTLQEVPASYLVWFMNQKWSKDRPALLAYCKKNERALRIEADEENEGEPDGFMGYDRDDVFGM